MKESRTVVVCGLHRSGTTLVGRILSLASSTYVLHEPFNPVWGVEYAPPTYTYWQANQSNINSEQITNQALSFYGNFAKPLSEIQNLQKLRYKILGGKQHLQWNALKVRRFIRIPPEFIVWKDPFCTFMVDYLSRDRQIKTVVMLRHPCAHFYSVDKQKWNFDIDNLIHQKKLINNYGKGITENDWNLARCNNLISIALLWKIMSRMLQSVSVINNNLLIVRHEDLCTVPDFEFCRICNHFGINYTTRMQKYLKRTTQGSSAEAPEGKIHDFHRDSKALVNIWKENLSQLQQETLLQVVGEDIRPFYNPS